MALTSPERTLREALNKLEGGLLAESMANVIDAQLVPAIKQVSWPRGYNVAYMVEMAEIAARVIRRDGYCQASVNTYTSPARSGAEQAGFIQ